MNENIIPHKHNITKADRQSKAGHKSIIVWFVGLSGSGKSTIAGRLEEQLHARNINTYLLDGDNIRTGLNKNLDFTEEGRKENIRRIGEVAKLFVDAGTVVLTAFISPFKEDRQTVRDLVGDGEFFEVFVSCPLEVCEQRDVKGLYKKARAGEIKNFTGIDSPFEEPENAEMVVHSDKEELDVSVSKLLDVILPKIKIE